MPPPATPTTRQRLLDTAERLFAVHGLAEVSLRQITTEAQANLAAVHYHFGSKQELIREVFHRRLGPMNAERLRRLDALPGPDGPAPPSLRQVLEAFLVPAFERSRDDGGAFFALAARAHSATNEDLQRIFLAEFDEVSRAFGAAFGAALPGVRMDELYWRIHFVIGSLCHTVLSSNLLEILSRGAIDVRDHDAILERLIGFAEAGVRTALTHPVATPPAPTPAPEHEP